MRQISSKPEEAEKNEMKKLPYQNGSFFVAKKNTGSYNVLKYYP